MIEGGKQADGLISGGFFIIPDENQQLVECVLCPHRCRLKSGTLGRCRVRQGGIRNIQTPFYGMVSSLAMDPIEKKPLYHYRPGSTIFSVGFAGCNLRCPFCQNWQISQSTQIPLRHIGPQELVTMAQEAGSAGIAYTYSEPLVHVEYLLDAMAAAHKAGLANVLVTNGCILSEPAREILALTDAANIDLKSFNETTYRDVLGGDLDTVCNFIRLAADQNTHIELTTLVVTDINDTMTEM
ncbi:MAG: radical SAM protein [Termitinemataceae bacterium]